MKWFLFELANEWHMPVARLLDTMDSHELSEWRVFFRLRHERREREAKGLPPPETRESLQARFAGRIKKKGA